MTTIIYNGTAYVPDITGFGVEPIWYLIGLMVTCVLLFIGMLIFSPFLPYAFAQITKRKLLLAVDKTRQVKLMGADIRNGMYYFKNRPWRFVKQYPGTFWIGKGVPFEIIHIDLGFVQDPYMNAAVEELREKYGIENYLELQKAIEDGDIAIDDEILIPLFFSMPMDALLTYGAVVPPSDITGEVEDLVEDRKNSELTTLKKLMPWVLVIVALLMGGALAYAIVSGV